VRLLTRNLFKFLAVRRPQRVGTNYGRWVSPCSPECCTWFLPSCFGRLLLACCGCCLLAICCCFLPPGPISSTAGCSRLPPATACVSAQLSCKSSDVLTAACVSAADCGAGMTNPWCSGAGECCCIQAVRFGTATHQLVLSTVTGFTCAFCTLSTVHRLVSVGCSLLDSGNACC
jgi:hypothetical protein